ncbi:MAG TPA: hypothetical protein VF920_08125, partial [Dongiaceae bacterium]
MVMEIDYPMSDDANAAGLVTGGPTLDMDPRDKHEDDNRECVCRCAPTASTAVIHGLVAVGAGR